jgi:hypothetical protein
MPATDNTGAAFEDINSPITYEEAEDVFLKNFLPPDAKKKPSDEAEEDTKNDNQPEDKPEDQSADDEEGQPDDAEGEEEGDSKDDKDEDEKSRKYAEDDVFVKIKVGEEEHQVPVKDLQRLYGQEAALTRKSMEVAEKRKAVEDELTKASVATSALLERAKQALAPYQQIDFLLASQQLPPEQYAALRNEALAAHQNVEFLEKHLGGLMDGIKQKKQGELVKAAQESLKVLTGPADKGGIPNFNDKLYDEIRAFAISEGAPVEVINEVVDPWAIRLMHDAMLYRRGQSKVITKKVNKTPKKIIKTTTTVDPSKRGTNEAKRTEAIKKLRVSGSTDDAAEAFLAGWQQSGE